MLLGCCDGVLLSLHLLIPDLDPDPDPDPKLLLLAMPPEPVRLVVPLQLSSENTSSE